MMKIFDKATVKLTAIYTIIIMVVSLSFSMGIGMTAMGEIRRPYKTPDLIVQLRVESDFANVYNHRVHDVETKVWASLFWINVGILIAGAMASYLLARRTLKPIEKAMEDETQFVSDASHELRTPLAVLRTRIDVFRKKERQQTEYDELVNTMETYVNRLSSLVGNLLELTDTGELPDVQRVSLDSVLAHVAADLGPLAHESNVSLSCHAQPVSVMGNASLLYRAFYNLAENAIRYNFNGGKVELQLSASREGAVATVSDTGVGIAPDVRELVFEPFYRVNKSRSREFGGAGIGLSLVKTILARHGARVAVGENQPQGSVFTVTFGSGGEVLTERG